MCQKRKLSSSTETSPNEESEDQLRLPHTSFRWSALHEEPVKYPWSVDGAGYYLSLLSYLATSSV